MSKYEVKRDGKTFESGDVKVMPDADRRKQMRVAGYKIYVDGKVYKQ